MTAPKIIQNAIKLPNGEFLVSIHQHDFKSAQISNNQEAGVDGGLAYIRRCGDFTGVEEYSLTDDMPFEIIKRQLLWGVLDKTTKKHTFKRMADLSSDHLRNILRDCVISPLRRDVINAILEDRNDLWKTTYSPKSNQRKTSSLKPKPPKRRSSAVSRNTSKRGR